MGVTYVPLPTADDCEVQVSNNTDTNVYTAVGYCLTTGRFFDIQLEEAREAIRSVCPDIPHLSRVGYVEDYNKDTYYLGAWATRSQPLEKLKGYA